VAIARPRLGRIAAQPDKKVIEPPAGMFGAAWRAHTKLPKNLPFMNAWADARSCCKKGLSSAPGVAVMSK
jgi:hypothetical protein